MGSTSLLRRCLEIREAKQGKDHADVAVSLNNLAWLYESLGQYAKAGSFYERSLTIYESKLGKNHPDVAVLLSNLGVLYTKSSQYAKAEPLLKRSLGIRESKLGKDHPDVATSLHNLAGMYLKLEKFETAEPLLKRSLGIRESKLGKDHPHVATSLGLLAGLYEDMGQHAKAEPLHKRTLGIREAKLGKDHPGIASTLYNLALLHMATGDPDEAGRRLDRARRIFRRHLASVFPALTESEKSAFFENTSVRDELQVALSLGLSQRTNPALAAMSASWLLNGKAAEQEGLASSILLARESSDPKLGELARQLQGTRQKLARLTFATPEPGQETRRLELIEDLRSEEQRLGKELRQAGNNGVVASWVEQSDLRKALPRDAVFIDIARFRAYDFKPKEGNKRWKTNRYAAWVTSRSGPVRVVDLGPAIAIDEVIVDVRRALEDAGKQIKKQGEEKAAKNLGVHLEALSKLVLKPLLPHIGKSKSWLLSPDGNLWLVPWESLPLADGKFAVEKYKIGYLTSGRDLIPAVAPKVKVSAPLVLADPDYDRGQEGVRGKEEESGRRSLKISDLLGRDGAMRLPGTAAEAKAITPALQGFAGVAPRVYTQEKALSAAFTSVRSPRVAVLCTHGFFLPDKEVARESKPGKSQAAFQLENPLLRCGLLLAGCNKGGGRGVLTGLEVVGTDLRGCELVVLSACDTGLGDVQVGEGVAGLRQAFQLAGARAVVSTLWSVPDKQSARLMVLFFANLAKGMTKADALRAAKLAVIEERREDFAAAHPFFWAAFTLTGQSGEPDKSEAVSKADRKAAQDAVRRGDAMVKERKYAEAVRAFTEALEIDPADGSLWTRRSLANRLLDRKADAFSDSDEGVRLRPNSSQARTVRGLAYWANDDLGRALADFDEAIRIDPKYKFAHYEKGRLLAAQRKHKEAVSCFSTVIELDPKYAGAYHNRGRARDDLGEPGKALEDLTEAIRLNPRLSMYFNSRATAHLRKKENDKAIEDATEAIKLDGKYSPAYLTRGNAYRAKGEHAKALADYDEAVRLSPRSAPAYNRRGHLNHQLGEHMRAVADFARAIELSPRNADSYLGRASAYDALDEADKAKADRDKARELTTQ